MAKRLNRGCSTPETNSQTLLLRKIYSWNIPHWYFAYSLTIPFVLLHGILVSLILLPTSHSNPNIYPSACSLTHQSSSHPRVCPISNINLNPLSPLSLLLHSNWVGSMFFYSVPEELLEQISWLGLIGKVLPVSGTRRVGVLLNILQCMGQPSNFKDVSTPKTSRWQVEKNHASE